MIWVYLRIFFKIIFFLFLSLFIIFYIVFWYRYDYNIWFIKKNVYLKINFWSNDNYLKLWDIEFYPVDWKIDFYWIDAWCYDLNYFWEKYKRCFDNNKSYQDNFLRLTSIEKIHDIDKIVGCKYIDKQFHEKYCIDKFNNYCLSEEIDDVFSIKEINFINTKKSIYYCNLDNSNCKYLYKSLWKAICYKDEWIVFYNSWFYLYKLK